MHATVLQAVHTESLAHAMNESQHLLSRHVRQASGFFVWMAVWHFFVLSLLVQLLPPPPSPPPRPPPPPPPFVQLLLLFELPHAATKRAAPTSSDAAILPYLSIQVSLVVRVSSVPEIPVRG
jgi:hypothetical protein